MPKEVMLYTTAGCHLCELADEMMRHLSTTDPLISGRYLLRLVEIADDKSLVELYGVRIPVLCRGEDELGWPFEPEVLRDWLINLNS